MNLLAEVLGLEILLHVLGHKLPPVRRRVDEEILGSRCNRAVEHDLERLVARGLRELERQVVAKQDKPLGPPRHLIDDIGEIDEIVLFHFDEAQALWVEFVEHGLDERGLPRATRTGQERVVGGSALDELARVLLDQRPLAIDAVEIRKSDTVQVCDGLDKAAARRLAPAESYALVPVDWTRCRREQRFHALEQRFAALDQSLELGHDSS